MKKLLVKLKINSTKDNPAFYGVLSQRFGYSIFTNAYYGVDSFLVLSGILNAYGFMRSLNTIKTIKMSFMLKFYFHRFWR